MVDRHCAEPNTAENENEPSASASSLFVDPLLGMHVETREVVRHANTPQKSGGKNTTSSEIGTTMSLKETVSSPVIVGSLFEEDDVDDDDGNSSVHMSTVPKVPPEPLESERSLLRSLTDRSAIESTGLFDDDDLPPLSSSDDDDDEDDGLQAESEVELFDVDLDQTAITDIDISTRHARTVSEPPPHRFSEDIDISATTPERSISTTPRLSTMNRSISGIWRCNKCTLINSKPFAPVCEMCGSSRIEDPNVDSQIVKLQFSLLTGRESTRRNSSPAQFARRGAEEFVEVPLHSVAATAKQLKKEQKKVLHRVIKEEDDLWNEALSRSKGIRDALSIRIVRSEYSNFTSYHIRVIDMSTGFRWIVKRRYRQFYQLHQQITRLTSEYPWQTVRGKQEAFVEARALRRITSLEFPSRRDFSNMMQRTRPADGAKTKRQKQLELFLRHVSALVAPAPLGDVREKALLLLQDFLDVDLYKVQLDDMDIFRWGTEEQKGIVRVKVKTYRILNDPYTKEGSAILRYLTKFEKMLSEGDKTKEFILGLLQEVPASALCFT